MEQEKEYFAFISYKREDEKWAKWLQHKLEHYKLPSNVRKGNEHLPKDLRPVFKDTSELASGVLADEIHRALDNSQYLIVICSPRSAQSGWVCKEIGTFIEQGRTKDIIPFIIEGEAYSEQPERECLPVALRELPEEQELLGVNVAEMGKDAAVVKVIAQMLGLKFDTLWQRHQKEQAQRRTVLGAAAAVLITILVASFWIWQKNQQLQRSNQKIMEAQSRFIAEKINTLIEDGDSYTATMLALETLPKNLTSPDRPYVPESEFALRQVAFRHSALLRMKDLTPLRVSFSQDGIHLLALASDSTVKVWDASTGAAIDTLAAFPYGQEIDSYGQRSVTLFESYIVRLSDNAEKMWANSWEEQEDSISGVAISPDGELVASVSKDGFLRTRVLQTGAVVDSVKAHEASIRSLSFSPDGQMIATASTDGTAKIWDRRFKKRPVVLRGHQARVFSAVFSPDGRKVVTSSEDHTAKVWDARTGKMLGTLAGHEKTVRGAAFSPDGQMIATCSYDKTIKLWDASTLDSIRTLKGHKSSVCSISFSPDSRTVASVSWDNTVKLWNVKDGSVIKDWEAHHRGIHSVCFSPDGKRLITASWEYTAKVWDVATGRLVHELKGHTRNVTSASFSPEGSLIVTSSEDGTVKTWEFLPLQRLIDVTRTRFGNRQLTAEEREQYYLE